MAHLLAEDKKTTPSTSMPDISFDVTAEVAGTLHRVGMTDIELPILVADDAGNFYRQPAKVKAYVSLDQPVAKGIHMSRLYLTLKEEMSREPLTLCRIKDLLDKFIEVQKGLSISSYLRVDFQKIVERQALLSGETGWRQYPLYLAGRLEKGKYEFSLGAEVMYSSTCPCSAALSRSLTQEKFLNDFKAIDQVDRGQVYTWLGEQRMPTPHAQRSFARVDIKLGSMPLAVNPLEFIDAIEHELRTPVQTAVKRQDEQEFARLNGENLMFCEDAARKIRAQFESDQRISDYRIFIEHVESLHPHSAVSKVVKGIPGGYTLEF